MIDIIVGLGIIQLIDWLFPNLKDNQDSILFLIDLENKNPDSETETEVEYYDW